MNYRNKVCVKIIRFPAGFVEESRGLKVCCDRELVLASQTSNDTWENDKKMPYVKVSDVSDTVTFIIEKCGEALPLPNLGEFLTTPQDDLARGFIYDWKQYLLAYGPGKYDIKIEFTISGVTGGYTYGQYNLKNYSITNARHTSRVRSKFNSKYQKLDIDFTNSNGEDTVRFFGFFGLRQPKTEINNLLLTSRASEKVTRENLNTWTLQTDPLDINITRQLLDFHFLVEDECFISDHNRHNHDYLLFDKAVVLEETPEVDYMERNRKAKITATFGDRKKVDKSYYNVQ